MKNYEPDKSFCKWNLQSPGPGRAFFTAFLEMAEQDTGQEFAEFLDLLWEQIAPKVIDLVEKLFIAAVAAGGTAAAAGGLGGFLAGPGGAVIGGIVGVVAGAAIGALIELFKDSSEDDFWNRVTTLSLSQ